MLILLWKQKLISSGDVYSRDIKSYWVLWTWKLTWFLLVHQRHRHHHHRCWCCHHPCCSSYYLCWCWLCDCECTWSLPGTETEAEQSLHQCWGLLRRMGRKMTKNWNYYHRRCLKVSSGWMSAAWPQKRGEPPSRKSWQGGMKIAVAECLQPSTFLYIFTGIFFHGVIKKTRLLWSMCVQ